MKGRQNNPETTRATATWYKHRTWSPRIRRTQEPGQRSQSSRHGQGSDESRWPVPADMPSTDQLRRRSPVAAADVSITLPAVNTSRPSHPSSSTSNPVCTDPLPNFATRRRMNHHEGSNWFSEHDNRYKLESFGENLADANSRHWGKRWSMGRKLVYKENAPSPGADASGCDAAGPENAYAAAQGQQRPSALEGRGAWGPDGATSASAQQESAGTAGAKGNFQQHDRVLKALNQHVSRKSLLHSVEYLDDANFNQADAYMTVTARSYPDRQLEFCSSGVCGVYDAQGARKSDVLSNRRRFPRNYGVRQQQLAADSAADMQQASRNMATTKDSLTWPDNFDHHAQHAGLYRGLPAHRTAGKCRDGPLSISTETLGQTQWHASPLKLDWRYSYCDAGRNITEPYPRTTHNHLPPFLFHF